MNKILHFCIVLSLSLILLSGCKSKDQEYYIDVKFTASGFAADNVKLHVLVDNVDKGVISPNSQSFAFENKLKGDHAYIEIVPEFTEATPSDTFDFVCNADVMITLNLPSENHTGAARLVSFSLSENVTKAPAESYPQVITEANYKLHTKFEVTKDNINKVE